MRTYFVIGLLLLLFSCSKKEEAPATTENFFAIGDQRYPHYPCSLVTGRANRANGWPSL